MSPIRSGRQRALLAWAVAALGAGTGCESNVQSELPPLVQACQTAADCPVPYQCAAGACEIASCACDADCPAPLLCEVRLSVAGQCLAIPTGFPCDGGVADAGFGDGGAPDGG